VERTGTLRSVGRAGATSGRQTGRARSRSSAERLTTAATWRTRVKLWRSGSLGAI